MQNFTPEAYSDIVASLLRKGYEIKGYNDAQPDQPHLILRHDVDFDLDTAVRMAELESANGWTAHYFALVRSEFYNLFSKNSSTALLRLCALGHTVGLHFDAQNYPLGSEDVDRGLAEEFSLIEQIAKRSIDVFSLHRPQPDVLNGDLSMEGRVNTYAPRYTEEMGYCSDSRGGWHHGYPLDDSAVRASRGLQLLTHPIWWMESRDSPQKTLESVLDRHYANLEAEATAQCGSYTAREMPITKEPNPQ